LVLRRIQPPGISTFFALLNCQRRAAFEEEIPDSVAALTWHDWAAPNLRVCASEAEFVFAQELTYANSGRLRHHRFAENHDLTGMQVKAVRHDFQAVVSRPKFGSAHVRRL